MTAGDSKSGAPNLDAMFPDDLREFGTRATLRGIRPIALARTLFPDKPKGYVRATRDLGHYAWNKATAMGLRERGEIARALSYEWICDSIYNNLPEFARW